MEFFCFWLGCILVLFSFSKICKCFFRKKAAFKISIRFIPLKDALHQLPDLLKTYEQMDWASVGISQEDHYLGQILYALAHEKLAVYGTTWFGQEKIPSDQLPPYEKHTWGSEYDRIDDESKDPLYTDLSVKKGEFEEWVQAQQPYST